MEYEKKKLGVIVGVEGSTSLVGMYHMSNDSEYLWYGEILNGVKVGAYLTINQNDISIIATVLDEKVIDQQNSIKSNEFDNRYSSDSINRIVRLKTKGAIINGHFSVTSRYIPMVGNEVTLTNREELDAIYDINNNVPTISIGKSLLEEQKVKLPINSFFASHIGIFGNTGSGKSNTLHKLYLELFKSGYYEGIKNTSQFFVIDFNGEYTSKGQFGGVKDKRVFNLNTRKKYNKNRLPISKDYLFDPDILSILFDAKSGTQVPFLRNALNYINKKKKESNFDFGYIVTGLLIKILTTGTSTNQDSLQDWIDTATKYDNYTSNYNKLKHVIFNSTKGNYYILSKYHVDKYGNPEKGYLNSGGQRANNDYVINNILGINDIKNSLNQTYQDYKNEPLKKLEMFLEFEMIFQTAWGKVNREFLSPLLSRMNTAFNNLNKVIKVTNDSDSYSVLNIISLANVNKEMKRVIPMLASKMFYDQQKHKVSDEKVTKTKHLIIDEAHNILNRESGNDGDDWQDYRLSVFEEIIKEGRKFGFYLTLASQRPADISPTILSQVHNYLIHRIVNDKDLQILDNTMPTLDKTSYDKLPLLGKGEAIITGNAISIPIVAKIDKEENNRPDSDDVKLTELWNEYKEKDNNINGEK